MCRKLWLPKSLKKSQKKSEKKKWVLKKQYWRHWVRMGSQEFYVMFWVSQGHLKHGQESSSKIFKLFSVNIFAKMTLKLFVAMPNSKLHTNFQLNIFIFVVRVSLRTSLQSLKQKDREFLRQIFKFFLGRNTPNQNSTCLQLRPSVGYLRIFSSITSFLRPEHAFKLYFSHWSEMLKSQPR